jgi:hypothetical protein
MPTLRSHAHLQATQANRRSQNLSISVSEPTHRQEKIKTRKHNNRYKTCPSGHVS